MNIKTGEAHFMKTTFISALILLMAPLAALPLPLRTAVVEKGPHSQVIEVVTEEVSERGENLLHTNRYTELASGMNVFRDGDWRSAEAKFEVDLNPASVVARQLQFELRLGANANAADAVQLVLPDGQQRVRSQIYALQYWDSASGEVAPLGFIQDSQAELLSETQVVYRRALDGIQANLVYEIALDHAEQNLAILEQPPAPEVLNPKDRKSVV